jgi:phosphoribosyl-dephospho-CoA transferase
MSSIQRIFEEFNQIVFEKIESTTKSCLTEAMYLALHRGGWAMQKQLNTHQAHLISATLKVPGARNANGEVVRWQITLNFHQQTPHRPHQ